MSVAAHMNSCIMYLKIRIVVFVILYVVFSAQCSTNNNKIFCEIISQLFGGIHYSALVGQRKKMHGNRAQKNRLYLLNDKSMSFFVFYAACAHL